MSKSEFLDSISGINLSYSGVSSPAPLKPGGDAGCFIAYPPDFDPATDAELAEGIGCNDNVKVYIEARRQERTQKRITVFVISTVSIALIFYFIILLRRQKITSIGKLFYRLRIKENR